MPTIDEAGGAFVVMLPNLLGSRVGALESPADCAIHQTPRVEHVLGLEALLVPAATFFEFDPEKPLPNIWLPGKPGINVLMADGSVRFINRTISEQTLKNAIQADEGIPLGPDWNGNRPGPFPNAPFPMAPMPKLGAPKGGAKGVPPPLGKP